MGATSFDLNTESVKIKAEHFTIALRWAFFQNYNLIVVGLQNISSDQIIMFDSNNLPTDVIFLIFRFKVYAQQAHNRSLCIEFHLRHPKSLQLSAIASAPTLSALKFLPPSILHDSTLHANFIFQFDNMSNEVIADASKD